MDKLVLIASSTGGPKALHNVIPFLKKNLDAPVVIVQHMPKGFTASLAERLNSSSEIDVSEAYDGKRLQKGHVYIARGGAHLILVKNRADEILLKEDDTDPINGLRPCADYTFSSVAKLDVKKIYAVVLTGMGSDGTKGIKALKEKHDVYTITQSKETCVVYGMPKVAETNNLSDLVLPLDKIGNEINKIVGVF